MRLDKLLSNMGFGSRKDVKALIKKNLVIVNGQKVKKVNMNIDPDQDEVTCNEEKVVYRDVVYFMLHRPPGYISATFDPNQKTVIDLLNENDRILDPFPVGRLDKDTEGLLLLTNDGQLAHQLLSPKKHVNKTYIAKVEGVVTEKDIRLFKKGLDIGDGYTTQPATLNIIQSDLVSSVEITITEGKFHQIKRMFEAVGKKVIYLKRISMGVLKLDDNLSLGKYRELTEIEIDQLMENNL